MKFKLPIVAAFLLCGYAAAHKTTPEWIKNAVFYDIYPSSFMDSDGNGIGDIPGIISRLDYVKSLGVDAIWMNPVFESGWFDGGYDIIDYYNIDPRFGTNADIRRLVDEAHKRGLKVCLDLVPGHTSNQSEWFKKAATEGPQGRYADYYIFSDVISAKDSADIIKRQALEDPDNSKLGPWVPTSEAITDKPLNGKYRGNFYRKNYYPCQPALNFGYANPDPSKPWELPVDAPGPKAVRRELKNIMAYWFDLGVDGFRVDMAASLVKNDTGKKETIKLWREIREWIDKEYPGKVLISEWGIPGQALPAGFDVDFLLIHRSPGFKQLTRGSSKSKSVAPDAYFEKTGKGGIDIFIDEYGKKYNAAKPHGYISLFSANHDINRLNSEGRDTPDQIKTFMTFLLTTPCVPFIHYGDEIMMRNVKGLPSVEGSREERSGTRTPMQWDNTPSVGFSTATPDKLYLPTFTDGGKLTVEAQEKDANSVLNFTRDMIKIRHQHPTLANDGDWQTISDPAKPYPWVYTRTADGVTYMIALNPGAKKVETTVSLPGVKGIESLISNGNVTAKAGNKGIIIKMAGVTSAIFKVDTDNVNAAEYQSSLPIKPGKGITVAGTVDCNGNPVEGVVVSDGYEVTRTDSKGAYYLKSKKQNPQVFICSPSGYDIVRNDVVPQFWADFTSPADKFERHDFRLKKVDNKKHAVLMITDVHLANQRNDVDIFSGPYCDVLKKETAELNNQGIPVYTLNLGDSSWDGYWYGHNYPVGKFRETLNDAAYPTAVYSIMGNHDNDPHVVPGENADFDASLPYQKAFGPRYYSQNIGDVHYIFLDNVNYINDSLPIETYKGINSKRNYKEDFTREQLDWLRKDLAFVHYDTPIIVAMHGPMFRWKNFTNEAFDNISENIKIRTDKTSTNELLEILKPYKNVHSVSGHSHKQCLVRLPANQQNFTEHNISGTCGAWWKTRATGLKNLCPDGTPVAYEIFNIDGKNLQWEHKTYEYDSESAFYTWDMNEVKKYFHNNEEMKAFRNLYPEWTDYSELPENYIYVNVWAWDPEGKLRIMENGKELDVEMIETENPLYIASYSLRNTLWQNEWDKPGYKTPKKFQLFRAKASSSDSPVEISWTDYFGKETKSTLFRPSSFQLETL